VDKHISLSPCPFCGDKTAEVKQDGAYWWVECQGCGATGHVHLFIVNAGNARDITVDSWNTRPIEDRLRKDITGYRRTILQQGHLIMGLEEDNSNLSYEVHWRDKHIMELENAWLLDETVQKNGSLRPSISDTIHRYETQIAELETENIHLLDALHNKTLQFDTIADLNNKYRTALNNIYKNGKDHDVEWCQHKAKEELSE